MWIPKRTKYRKMHKMVSKNMEYRTILPKFGTYALKSLENGRLSGSQLEAARRVLSKRIKKIGKLWIRVFPFVPVSEKPLEVRMGKGKGYVEYWVAPIKAGQIIFEIEGVSLDVAKELLSKASYKLPMKTKFVETRLVR